MKAERPAFPDGHFYSPIVDVDDVFNRQDRIWPREPKVLGIDFAPEVQKQFLNREFRTLIREYDYPDDLPTDAPSYAFHSHNSQFSWLDARALFVMLRSLQPANMIEIGSGFSSLLTADVNRRFLGGRLNFTCIEPYPRPFLLEGVPGISRLVQNRVEDLPLTQFERLHDGDILFIDSSHVSKTGSDLNYIMFEILPRLRPGVAIHFHDIFLPNDYPKDWVITEGRSWNEQYLVRALLMHSHGFEVLFGSAYAFHYYPEILASILGTTYGGGSFWVRVSGANGDRPERSGFRARR